MTHDSTTMKPFGHRRSRPRQSNETIRLSPASLMLLILLSLLLSESASAFSAITRSSTHQATTVYTGLPLSASAASEQQQDSRWWKSLVSSTTTSPSETHQDDSSSVDEYLRFLERRYTRLYEDEPEATKASFSVMEWLKQGEEEHKELQQQDHNDAFYALGVAGLAGKEILQAHAGNQVLSPSDSNLDLASRPVKSSSSNWVASSAANAQESKQSIATRTNDERSVATMAAALSVVVSRVLAQRRVFLQLQTRRVHGLLVAAVKAIKMAAPKKLVKQVWHMGGGKQNVIATVSVVAAVVIVAIRIVVQEGLGA